MMGYLFLMTFSGSILFIGFLFCEKMLTKSMTQSMRYRALIIVMLDYMVPWVWIKGIYKSFIEFFWPEPVAAGAKGIIDVADIEAGAIAYQTEKYKLLTLAVSIWFAVALILLIIRILKSLTRTHALRVLAIKCEDKNLEETMKHLRETVHYRCKPEIAWTRVDNATFTVGTVKPVIFLQKEYAEGDLYWILKHEMTHIVNKDLWIKLLLEFVCCLHWFNPFIYFLVYKIKFLSETSCDEKVIKGCTDEEKQIYMDLLDRNRGNNTLRGLAGSTAESDKGEIDRRIALMKNSRNISPKEKVIALSAFGVLVFLNSLTALAYPDVHHVKNAAMEMAEDAVDGNNFWIYEYAADGYNTPIEVILYDEQFVDEEKRVYQIVPTKEASCMEHDFVSGVLQIHTRDKDGGCMVETYEGVRCTKCGATERGKLLHEAETPSCTH